MPKRPWVTLSPPCLPSRVTQNGLRVSAPSLVTPLTDAVSGWVLGGHCALTPRYTLSHQSSDGDRHSVEGERGGLPPMIAMDDRRHKRWRPMTGQHDERLALLLQIACPSEGGHVKRWERASARSPPHSSRVSHTGPKKGKAPCKGWRADARSSCFNMTPPRGTVGASAAAFMPPHPTRSCATCLPRQPF